MTDIHEVALEVAQTERKKDNTVVLSTGVVLKVKSVSRMLLGDLMRKYERPKPPLVFNRDIGRSEENQNDPDYKARLTKYDTDVAMGVVDVMIMMGTEIKSLPKGFIPIDGNWDDGYDALGITVGSGKKRYLNWVKHIAAPDDNDVNEIMFAIGRLSGVAEEDVNTAATLFRDKDK